MGLMTAGGGLANSKLVLANAAEGDVLSGKTFYATEKALRTGTMPNNGAWSSTIGVNGSVIIPQGYHTGGGRVSGVTIKTQYCVVFTVGASTAGSDAIVYRLNPDGGVESVNCLGGGSAFGAFTFSGSGDSIDVRYNKTLKVLRSTSFRRGLGTLSFGPNTGESISAGTSRHYGGPGGSGNNAIAINFSLFEEV